MSHFTGYKHPLANMVLTGALATLCGYAQAACETPAMLPGAQSYSACKDWPVTPTMRIYALAKFEADNSDPSGDIGSYDLSLELRDSSTDAPLAVYHKAQMFNSDAIAFEGMGIDTARYVLNSSVRAFGVRGNYEHGSSAAPASATDLNLFIKEPQGLRPVLVGLAVAEGHGESDTVCEGYYVETQRSVEIGKGSSHGFADLVVHSVRVRRTSKPYQGECQETTGKAQSSTLTLHYDGVMYEMPEALKPFR